MPDVQLSGGNAGTNQYTNYYNQIRTTLQQNPNTVTPQVIQAPQQIQAQTIEAPERIQAQMLEQENRTYGDYANEAASYLRHYLDNSIASRRRQTADARAAADVDAYSRGMGGSTWLTDAKNRMAAAEASDIMAAQNEFLGRVGEQAYNAMQAQAQRNLQIGLQNAANQLTADQQNAAYQNAVNQFNANALMNIDQYNTDNALRVAMQNAANALEADEFNAQLYQTLEQLAWGRAADMYNVAQAYDAAHASGGGGGYGGNTGGGVETLRNPVDLSGVARSARNVFNAATSSASDSVANAIQAAMDKVAQIQKPQTVTGRAPLGGRPVQMVKE